MTVIPAGSRVLVTGATGFIGRHLATALMAAQADVYATSRGAPPATGSGMQWRRCDLLDSDAVRRLFAEVRPDYAFHLSSLADGRRDRDLVVPIFRSETIAAVNVLNAASESGTGRLLLPGSLEESAPGEIPSSPYAAAKAATRAYAQMFHALYGLPVVMTRIFMAYGPGQPAWKLIPAVAAGLMRGEAPVVTSPDRQVDWIYVADVVDGLIRAATAPGMEGQSVDIGSGELTAIRDVVERLCALIDPAIRPEYGGAGPRVNEQVRCADVGASLRLIGWRAGTALEEGLRRTVVALQQPRSG